jgi:5-hydroxyisourate hydrolase-like protein (transthyretin family)
MAAATTWKGGRENMGLHVRALDMTYGKPAVGVDLTISRTVDGIDYDMVVAKTKTDGHASAWLGSELERGTYCLKVDVSTYFSTAGVISAYQSVLTTFRVPDTADEYQIDLSISPYGCYIAFKHEPVSL